MKPSEYKQMMNYLTRPKKQKIKLFSMIQSQDYSQIKINLLLIKMQIQLVFIMTYTKNMYPIFKRKKSSLDLRKKN